MPSNKYQIKFLKIAEEDFVELSSYIASENISAAKNITNKIEKNLLSIVNNPMLGRIPRDEDIRNLGYRYLIVQNYIIFYTVEKTTIFIHRIMHRARNYKSIL